MPTWPTTFPFICSPEDYVSVSAQRVVRRTQMSRGPDKVRRIATTGPEIVRARLGVMTAAEFSAFRHFFNVDLASGALAFDAPDILDGAVHSWRFVGEYQVEISGLHRRVSVVLERLP